MSLNVPSDLHERALLGIMLYKIDKSLLILISIRVLFLKGVFHQVAAIWVLLIVDNSSGQSLSIWDMAEVCILSLDLTIRS